MPSQTIYATFIGINAYPQIPLFGCVNDVLDMDLLMRDLTAQQSLEYKPLYMLSPHERDKKRIKQHWADKKISEDYQPATFARFTSGAFDQWADAKSGDTCLLYYSGHGSHADAAPVFWHTKPDRQNETIVCVDSRDPQTPSARDVLDKELGFLLWNALKGKDVHCLVIMDCCHSGNNTRAAIEDANNDIRFRRATSSRNQIPIENYLGYKVEGFYSEVDGKADIAIAKYVHLAAARDTELAKEINGNGLFSRKLIESLRSGGMTKSYRELVQSLTISVRNVAGQQNPVAFATDEEDLNKKFLGTGIKPYQPTYELRFDRGEWKMYGGSIHNITTPSANSQTKVRITGGGITAAEKIEAGVKQVFADTSLLEQETLNRLDKKGEDYRAMITQMANPILDIGLADVFASNQDELKSLEEAYKAKINLFCRIDFKKRAANIQYEVRLTEDKKFVLTKPGSYTPLFKRKADPLEFLNDVDTVCKWLSVSELSNASTNIKSSDFKFILEKIEGQSFNPATINSLDGQKMEVTPGEENVLRYIKEKQPPALRLSVQLLNPQIQPCFAAALYMDSLFGIKTDFIKKDNSNLMVNGEPLDLLFIQGGREFKTIPLSIDKNYADYNINEITDFVKIFISNSPIDLDRYKQGALSMDEAVKKGLSRGAGFEPGGAFEDDDDAAAFIDWSVFTFPIRIVNANKEKQLQPGIPATFASFSIDVPGGFTANAFAATGNDIQKKLNTVGSRSADDYELVKFIAPSENIWPDDMVSGPAFPGGLSAASDNGIKVLEIFSEDPEITTKVNSDTEILIRPKQSLSKAVDENGLEETIIPYGYDEETGLYFPAGYADETGVIHINTLPQPTPGRIQGDGDFTRSVGSSIKLFFKRIFIRSTGNTLTLWELNEGEDWKQVTTDPAVMKKTLLDPGNKDANIVLLVHGILGSMKDITGSLREGKDFHKAAKFILAYDYENLSRPLSKVAALLSSDLNDAGFDGTNGLKLSIVAHSMGGLVSRRLVESEKGDGFTKRLIFAGTPNAGSEMAQLKDSLLGGISHVMNVTGPLKYGLTAMAFVLKKLEIDPGKTLSEMSPRSEFLVKLLKSSRPGMVHYAVVGGNTGLLKNGYNGEDNFLTKIAASLKEGVLYPGLSKMLFDDKPNDMAVTAESMQEITGFDKKQFYPVANDHLSYFSEKPCREKLIELLTD